MFYVKVKTDEVEVKAELNDENVLCACPDCGKEVAVDLSCVFADGVGDMYGTAVLCNECAWKRLHHGSLFNSEGYRSPTEHEAFTRIEKEEKAARKAAAFRPIVYICSPYSGDTERNVENAKRYSRFAVDQHCLPITPHIYFTQFMNDNIPEERDTAIFMNWVLMSKCVELWVFGDTVSSGMKAEIDRAKRKHMKIRYFTEDLEEKI